MTGGRYGLTVTGRASRIGTITLPASWASALINGDFSGFNDAEELKRCAAELNRLHHEGWDVVSLAEREPRFTWEYGLYDMGSGLAGGEVLDYTILRR